MSNCHQVDGMDDRAEMDATFQAMATMGVSEDGRGDIVALTAGQDVATHFRIATQYETFLLQEYCTWEMSSSQRKEMKQQKFTWKNVWHIPVFCLGLGLRNCRRN